MDNKNLYNYCHVAERTDVGCKRNANEDFLDHFICENGLVSVVCDGMGGHVGGAVASHVAVETIRTFLSGTFIDDPKVAISKAIDAANEAILTRTMAQPELTGMGSTCVMLIVRDGKVYIGSVGDSRVYLVRERKIRQLTKDQSYVQMLVDMGQLTSEDAERHPRKNEITNALGIQGMKPATVLPDAISPEAGDCFLLCSDGLSGMVSDDEIQRIVSKQTEMGSQKRADTLVEMARRNGGLDNITVQLVEFAVTPTGNQKKPRKRIVLSICLVAIAIGVFIGSYSLMKNGDRQKLDGQSTRIDTLIYLGEIPFREDSEILKIGLDVSTKTTSVQFNNKDIRIPRITLDSLVILSKDTIKREQIGNDNNCLALKFSNTYLADSLLFILKDSVRVYHFSVCVGKKQQILEKTNETENVTLLPLLVLEKGASSGNAKSTNMSSNSDGKGEDKGKMEYTVQVKYNQKVPCFLTVYFGVKGTNENNKIYLPDESFGSVECDSLIRMSSSNEQDSAYSFSFLEAPNNKESVNIAMKTKNQKTIAIKINITK